MPAARKKEEFNVTANVPEPGPNPDAPPPPGPLQLQVRVDGRIVFQQFVHSYELEQQDDGFHVTGVTKVTQPAVEAAPDPA